MKKYVKLYEEFTKNVQMEVDINSIKRIWDSPYIYPIAINMEKDVILYAMDIDSREELLIYVFTLFTDEYGMILADTNLTDEPNIYYKEAEYTYLKGYDSDATITLETMLKHKDIPETSYILPIDVLKTFNDKYLNSNGNIDQIEYLNKVLNVLDNPILMKYALEKMYNDIGSYDSPSQYDLTKVQYEFIKLSGEGDTPSIIKHAIKNDIDLGISDDVKDIASVALKGNYKLR